MYLTLAFIFQILAVAGFYFNKIATQFLSVHMPLRNPFQELLVPALAFCFCVLSLYIARLAKKANKGGEHSGYRLLFAAGSGITAITSGKLVFTILAPIHGFYGLLPFSYLIIGGTLAIILPFVFAFAFIKD